MFVYFIVTILLPIFLFVTFYYIQSTRIIARELQQTYYAAFEKTAHRLELFVKQKEAMLAHLAYDTVVVDFVHQPSDANRKELEQIIVANTPSALNRDVLSIYDATNLLLYSNRYQVVSSMPQAFFDEMNLSRKTTYYDLQTDSNPPAVSLGRAIVNLQRLYKPIGFLTLYIDETFFSSLYAELRMNENTAFIAAADGRILSHPI